VADRLARLLEVAREAAAAAAAVARAASARPITAEVKGAGDYVTAADREAEAAAVAVLRRRTPRIAVLGEESGGAAGADQRWLVDPIDGTTNFLRAFPVVGVSVALLEERRPVVGAVEAPLLGRSWWGSRGQGAFDQSGRRLQVGVQPGPGVVSTGFPFRHKERLGRYLPVLERALDRFEDLRRTGAASLDLAFTAAGTWEGFFELGLGPWDIAAGTLLVREAGGVVTDWAGDPEAVFETGDILAGTPQAHELLLGILRDSGADRPVA
jgi:myo-inositol-1(or 4)-monophosphatase